jgi:hypothetical protein
MVLAFLLGRYLLHDAVSALLLRRVPNFPEVNRRVAREGWKLVLLLRLSPLMPYNVSAPRGRGRRACGSGAPGGRRRCRWSTSAAATKAPPLPRPCPPTHPSQVLNYALGATSVSLPAYALPSAAAALLYRWAPLRVPRPSPCTPRHAQRRPPALRPQLLTLPLPPAPCPLPLPPPSCLFAYLGSAADDLVDLLSGGASASFGTYWMFGGTVMAVGSAWGMAKVCHRLLAAPAEGGGAGAEAGGGGPDYAPVPQQPAAAGGAGAGSGEAGVGAGAGGKGGAATGGRAVQLVEVVAGGGGGAPGGGGDGEPVTPLYTISSLPRQASGAHRRASHGNGL